MHALYESFSYNYCTKTPIIEWVYFYKSNLNAGIWYGKSDIRFWVILVCLKMKQTTVAFVNVLFIQACNLLNFQKLINCNNMHWLSVPKLQSYLPPDLSNRHKITTTQVKQWTTAQNDKDFHEYSWVDVDNDDMHHFP